MLVPPRLAVRVLGIAGLVSWLAPVARAQEAGSLEISEGIDDPKLERRLGARIELGGASVPGAASAVPAEATPVFAPPEPARSPSPEGAVESRPAPPPAAGPRVPHLKVAYRFFNFAQVKAAGEGPGADEAFHVVSLDFYPISSKWRFGLSTQYGWEDGTFRANGDAFIAQSVSLGGQIPGRVFTPFFEAYAGGGMMQRMHKVGLLSAFTVYGQLGLDVGTEIFLARYAYLSLAIGFLHGTNTWARQNMKSLDTESMSVDTWSLKIGFGI